MAEVPFTAVPVGLCLQNGGTLSNKQPPLRKMLTLFSSTLFRILPRSSPFLGARQDHG